MGGGGGQKDPQIPQAGACDRHGSQPPRSRCGKPSRVLCNTDKTPFAQPFHSSYPRCLSSGISTLPTEGVKRTERQTQRGTFRNGLRVTGFLEVAAENSRVLGQGCLPPSIPAVSSPRDSLGSTGLSHRAPDGRSTG